MRRSEPREAVADERTPRLGDAAGELAVGAGSDRPAPIPVTWRTTLLAIALGSVGGWLATLANIPLPWMIGAMSATTIAAAAGLPVAMPPKLRSVMVAILGIMLGSGFTPEIVERMGEWVLSLAMLAAYTAFAGCAAWLYFHKVCRYDAITSYFAGMPGGLSEMVIVGTAMGGDARIISLSQASRLLLVVMSLPFAFQWLTGYEPATRPPAGLPLLAVAPADLVVLGISGAIGFFVARLIKIPAAAIVGPMVVSAAVHLAGWTAAKPPLELVAAAQIVVGAAIGCRFAGVTARMIGRAVVGAAGATVILLGSTVAFAVALSAAIGMTPEPLVLAYAPGGLAEMSLIAVAIGTDAAFVATHHIARIFLIVVFAPMTFRLVQRLRRNGAAG